MKWAFYAILGTILLSIVLKWLTCRPSYHTNFKRPLQNLVREASKYHVKAQQDSNPVVALLNANSALNYAKISRAMASDKDIEKLSGIKINELLYYLEEDQQKAVQEIIKTCPKIKPEGIYAVGSGWI